MVDREPEHDGEAAEHGLSLPPRAFGPGVQVGRYQLCFELAGGGMAKVYLARAAGAEGFEKLVALKRIHPHLAEKREFVEMFIDEARIASRISHPNVCTVFDFGTSGSDAFITMEYLLGETLARVYSRIANDKSRMSTPAWWALVLRIVADACEGLHAAHELRNDAGELLHVVHRDVSPANIFVTYDGTVKVVDFGVARANERTHHTSAGQTKGQVAYMAPEYARGKPIDRRADLWSIGVILFELLAGRPMLERPSDAAILMALMSGEIPSLASVRPELPEPILAIVARALSLDPERRPATARELARELERAILKLGEPVGRGEIEEFMTALFSTERDRRLALMAQARKMSPGHTGPIRAHGLQPLPGTGTPARGLESHVRPALPAPAEPDIPVDTDVPVDTDFAGDADEPIEEEPTSVQLRAVVHDPGPSRPLPMGDARPPRAGDLAQSTVTGDSGGAEPGPHAAFGPVAGTSTADPITVDPDAADPISAGPIAADPIGLDPIAADPFAAAPSAVEPVVDAPVAAGPVEGQLGAGEPSASDPLAAGAAHDPIAGSPGWWARPAGAVLAGMTVAILLVAVGVAMTWEGAPAAPTRASTGSASPVTPRPSESVTSPGSVVAAPTGSPTGATAAPPSIEALPALVEPSATVEPTVVEPSTAVEPAMEPAVANEPVAPVERPARERQTPRPERPRPRIAASLGGPGTVNVATPGGWAEVFENGQRIGRSPGRFELPAGRHRLELRPFGTGRPIQVTVTVTTGETTRVSQAVTP